MLNLFVGDPHVRPNNIQEWEKLASFIDSIIDSRKPDRLIFLGDQTHTHAVLRLEVLDFWDRWLDYFAKKIETVVLVGNHDISADYNQSANSMQVFKRLNRKTLNIIEKPTASGVFAYMPYYHDEQSFIKDANKLAEAGCKTLICHQTFDGSQYDNGMYAPDGFNTESLNFDTIISGHIHKRQRYGKIIYPGTSTWQNQSDANEEKGLWLATHDTNGQIISEEYVDTSDIVTKIISVVWKEGEEMPTITTNAKVTIELVGTSQWVSLKKKELKGIYSLKTTITDKIDKSIRNTGKGFQDFVSNIFVTKVDKQKLLRYMKENSIV